MPRTRSVCRCPVTVEPPCAESWRLTTNQLQTNYVPAVELGMSSIARFSTVDLGVDRMWCPGTLNTFGRNIPCHEQTETYGALPDSFLPRHTGVESNRRDSRVSNRRFAVFVVVIVGLGMAAGYRLSSLPKVESYKVLNVVGLSYDFLAVVVLSKIAAPSEKWKRISVETIARVVLWFHTTFPLGASFGGFLAAVLLHGSPSGAAVSSFAFSFFLYSLIPLSVLNETVTFPRFAALKSLESRWRWFGLYLLANGVGLQLIAGVLGLRS